jgi:hypothetical protein
MPSPSRGRRALLIVAVLLAVPLLGAGLTWFWIQRTADRKWAEAQLRIRELSSLYPDELPPAPSTEPSKELQIHFVAAIREAARRTSHAKEARTLLRRRQGGEALDVILGDAQDCLDRLHEGARRCAATPAEFPPGWRGEWDDETVDFLTNCAVLRARCLRERSAVGEAMETLLDSLQLGRFWAASGKGDNRLFALCSIEIPLEELRDMLAHDALPPDQLRRLVRELEPLEAALRLPTDYFQPALARWAEAMEREDLKDSQTLNEGPYRWRYLLPIPLMKAEAFEFYDRHLQRVVAGRDKPFLDLVREVKQLGEQRNASKNPLVSQSTVIRELEWNALERIAEFRLLRIAAHYRASGELLHLKDPYGSEILHSRSGGRMKFWSLAGDGRDNGGDAGNDPRWTWHIPVDRDQKVQAPRDIVIEVPVP